MDTAIAVALISAGATVVAATVAILPHLLRPKDPPVSRDSGERENEPATPRAPTPSASATGAGNVGSSVAVAVGKIYGLRGAAKLTGGKHDGNTRFQLKSMKDGSLVVQAHNRVTDPTTGRDVARDFYTVTRDDLVFPPPYGPRPSSVRVLGVSPSAQRAPRELDLALEGDEVSLHVHQPGGTRSKFWVHRDTLEATINQLSAPAGGHRIEVAARSPRKQTSSAFVSRDGGGVEIQADWWVWVSGDELREALHTLGIPVQW